MSEVIFKVEIPSELKERFEIALDTVVKEFIEDLEFSLARDILSKSKLTKAQAFKFAEEVKLGIARRHSLAS